MTDFKNYTVTITETKSKALVSQFEEKSKSGKFLYTKYRSRHEFDVQKKTVKVVRKFKKSGIQTNLIDMINEITLTN